MRFFIFAILVFGLTAPLMATDAEARVTVRQLSKHCGGDQKTYCAKVSYGNAMTECFVKHKEKLRPMCRKLVDRIEAGERVSLF